MMQGVLVLAGARQEGPYFDVIVSGFCGLVMLECLCFLLYLGFVGVFPLFPPFFWFWGVFYFFPFFFFFFFFFFFLPVLVFFLYTSCMLKDAFSLFINFFAYLSKKIL
jgi:hypothetical protein